ncbi:MAG: lipopolysaccharide transport periplasmic protein LptA [Gammaproteobacteria bacterium]|nr:lipopolysaccharide transport periplasmic protein LptA [Gammaproteobacteria bacterium]
MTTVKYSLLLALLVAPPLWALSDDSEQPIEVEADSLELREQENISVYQGNVSLRQGSLQIRSERLVIHFNEARDLVLMEMSGSPARFRQLDDEQREMLGQAGRINYRESESMLELLDNARFSHAGDTIESNLIRINTEDNNIQAGSADAVERVKMLIQPRTSATDPE